MRTSSARNWWVAVGMASAVVLAFYPIYFRPKLYPEDYKEAQKKNRAAIPREKLRQTGLSEWSDPFANKETKPKS